MAGDESTSNQQSSRKLKLVLKTSPLSTPTFESHPNSSTAAKDGSSSPPRPSFSPVTPTLPHEKLAVQEKVEKSEPQWIDPPPPLSLDLDENADAIALKATISLLQMQRQQSLKDIRDLDAIKDAALEDPRGFADDLRAGKLKKPMPSEIYFDDVEYEEEDGEVTRNDEAASKFGRLPNAQNVARAPPIEWSKYHILGKPLDDMHELQKRHPGLSHSDLAKGLVSADQEVTAPYRPFKDALSSKKQTKGHKT